MNEHANAMRDELVDQFKKNNRLTCSVDKGHRFDGVAIAFINFGGREYRVTVEELGQ